MQIEISFENWKELTALLVDENDSYDAVIARLLGNEMPALANVVSDRPGTEKQGSGAFYKGVFLPNGTDLRANYKGKTYYATISECEWIDLTTRESRTSPSQAAYSITGGNVNGWLFWLVKRPEDRTWQSLNRLRSGVK